jgi:hypothetical protein
MEHPSIDIQTNSGEKYKINIEANQKDSYLRFQGQYVLETSLENTKVKKTLNKNAERCRFCGKDRKEVTFKSEAHLIPIFLGKPQVLLGNECDACNTKFSKLETSLGDYTLFERSILSLNKRKGKPKFKGKEGIEISSPNQEEIRSLQVNLETENLYPITIELDSLPESFHEGKFNVSSKPLGFVPIDLWRVLQKIAISLIPESDFSHFTMLLSAVNNGIKSKNSHPVFSFFEAKSPHLRVFFDHPMVQVYRLGESSEKYFGRIMVFSWGRTMYQLMIPSNAEFERMNVGKSMQPVLAPHLCQPRLRDISAQNGDASILFSFFPDWSFLKLGQTEKIQISPEWELKWDPEDFEEISLRES